jgi:hypothetical protein
VLRDEFTRFHKIVDQTDPTMFQQALSRADKILVIPHDSAALDSAIKQAKREALLEAAAKCDWLGHVAGATTGSCAYELRRMAEELK